MKAARWRANTFNCGSMMNSMPHSHPPVALSIAGLDPSGGAGIIADIRTFSAFGCFPTAAVTSVTFQNTLGVFGAVHQTSDSVRSQVLPLSEDFTISCVKTGMLPTSEIIEEVVRLFIEGVIPQPIVDPVARSTSGHTLIDNAAVKSLVEKLVPISRLLTPNLSEAELMTGLKVVDEDGMLKAAIQLADMGAQAVLVKGGHLKASGIGAPEIETASDLLFADGEITWFRGPRIHSNSTHGTGCSLSAGIAAALGRGRSLDQAVAAAKQFVAEAIRTAPELGHGNGPMNFEVEVGL